MSSESSQDLDQGPLKGQLEQSSAAEAEDTQSSSFADSSSSDELKPSETSSCIAAEASADDSTDGPQHNSGLQEPIIAESLVEPYTFENLSTDINMLEEAYPQWVSVDTLTTTLDDRPVYHLIIGNAQAENRILIHAGIHGREYMTTQLVMKQAAAFLAHAFAGDAFNGVEYAQILETNAIHVIPSVDPDGAAISQFGIEGLQTEEARQRVGEITQLDGAQDTSSYYRAWKANANGVDLNRNFDALWDVYGGPDHPSSDHYKGLAPASEPETAALVQLTLEQGFSKTVSYHTHGSVIYWYFGQAEPLYSETEQFAQAVSNATGYPLDANYEVLDPAGYKDWALASLGIPSLTVEVGHGESPVPTDQFDAIWRENEFVWEAVLEM